jgi:predicted flap endonuclease-1-like 5' DNA nuclease
MKPTNRADITDLEDIPNVGPSIARSLRQIGIQSPKDIAGKDPYTMYDDLCHATGADKTPA